MKAPLYICGPTASGKTNIAIQLAHHLDGEIVNADAYQLYSGLETLSAAPTLEEQKQAPHHLFSVIPASECCNAMHYRELALPVISDIQSRGKTPIITGGSGLYLKFLTHGPSPVPSSDSKLRAELEKRSDDSLITEFRALDPEGAKITNLQNRRYVIRALEICLLSGQAMSEIKSDWEKHSAKLTKNLRGIYLSWDPEELRQRIAERTRLLLSEKAIDEVKLLQIEASETARKAIGFTEITALIKGEISHADCLEKLSINTRQYAKRQRSWFRRETWLTHLKCPYLQSDIKTLLIDL